MWGKRAVSWKFKTAQFKLVLCISSIGIWDKLFKIKWKISINLCFSNQKMVTIKSFCALKNPKDITSSCIAECLTRKAVFLHEQNSTQLKIWWRQILKDKFHLKEIVLLLLLQQNVTVFAVERKLVNQCANLSKAIFSNWPKWLQALLLEINLELCSSSKEVWRRRVTLLISKCKG